MLEIGRRRWLYQPHKCGVCEKECLLPYPTCGQGSCRYVWRRRAEKAARDARNAYRASQYPELCRRCKKRISDVALAKGYLTCGPCRTKNRLEQRKRAMDAAYQEYREKLALARAQRLIENHSRESKKIDREARAYVERLFPEPEPQEVEEI